MALAVGGPAFAHDNAVTAKVVCNVNYEWEVQWSVANDYGDEETVLASSDTSLFDVGDRIDEYDTVTQTEIVAGPIDKTLTITARWDDGWPDAAGLTRSGSISTSDFHGTCEPPTTPDADFTVDTDPATCVVGESLNAPVGTYVNFDPTNTPAGTTGPASWVIKGDAEPTHTFPNGDTSKTLSGTLAGPLDPDNPLCRKPVTPVGPTLIKGQCVANKVVPGSAPTFAELVALQPLGVVATLDAGSTTDGTFTAASGYYLTAGSLTTFSLKLDPDPTAADCTPPCTQHCTPPQPHTGDEVGAGWFEARWQAAWPFVMGFGVLIAAAAVFFVVTTVRTRRSSRAEG
jgi:hypothetical protein